MTYNITVEVMTGGAHVGPYGSYMGVDEEI